MLDTATEVHSPEAWGVFLASNADWVRFTREEQEARYVSHKPGWGGWPLVLSAVVSTAALISLFVWTVL